MDKVLISLCKMPQQQYTYDQLISMACKRIAELSEQVEKLHKAIDEQERTIAFLEDTKPW